MGKKCTACFLVISCMLAVSGCASYYQVTDPATGKVYYTEDIDRKRSGAIQFKDEVTETEVTLPTSEVMEITKDQYNANTNAR